MPSKSKKPTEAVKPVGPKPKFMHLGRGKYVHVVRTKAWDLKNSECQQVRKGQVADKFKGKGLSADAALALDGCDACGTAMVAQRVINETKTPEQRKAESEDRRNEVLDRAAGKKVSKKAAKVTKSKAVKKSETGDKAPKVKAAPTKTKSGTRSVGSDTDSKAKALAEFTGASGWDTSIFVDDETGHTVVEATKDEMVIHAYFIDGKYDVARHATINVGSWSGTLRGAHAVRRQVDMTLDDRDRPHPAPGKGRSGPKRKIDPDAEEVAEEDESPEDAARRVPFMVDDDDIAIIAVLRDKMIKWRNGKTGSLQQAWFPPKNGHVKIEANKDGRRYIVFDEVISINEKGIAYGKTLNVYLDKIIRVS
jgi:hypothetical protein